MHIIKSKNRLSDTLTVKSGVKTLTLTVDMDLAAAAQALRKAQQEVAEAQKVAIENRTQETAEAYGAALRGLICVVFGEKQTDSLIDFYEGQPQSMLGWTASTGMPGNRPHTSGVLTLIKSDQWSSEPNNL